MQRLQMSMTLRRLRKEQEEEARYRAFLSGNSNAPQQALAAGAAEGDIGPTETNAARIRQFSTSIPGMSLDHLRSLDAAGGRSLVTKILEDQAKTPESLRLINMLPEPERLPALRSKTGIAPQFMQFDSGGTFGTQVVDPVTQSVRRIVEQQKTAAPGSIPYQFSDLTPSQARLADERKASLGATRVSTINQNFEPAKEAIQREGAQQIFKNYEALKTVPDALAGIEKAKALIPKSGPFVGSGAEQKLAVVQFLNQNLGTNIRPEEAANAEVLRSLTFRQIIDNLKKMDSQPTQQQQEALRQAMGTLGTNPEALGRVLDVTADILRTRVNVHNKQVRQLSDRGITPGYDVSVRLPEGAGEDMIFDASGRRVK